MCRTWRRSLSRFSIASHLALRSWIWRSRSAPSDTRVSCQPALPLRSPRVAHDECTPDARFSAHADAGQRCGEHLSSRPRAGRSGSPCRICPALPAEPCACRTQRCSHICSARAEAAASQPHGSARNCKRSRENANAPSAVYRKMHAAPFPDTLILQTACMHARGSELTGFGRRQWSCGSRRALVEAADPFPRS